MPQPIKILRLKTLTTSASERQLSTPYSQRIVLDGRQHNSRAVCTFFKLPRELRDIIYGFSGLGCRMLHARKIIKDHKAMFRYNECQAERTAGESYAMSRERAHPHDSLQWSNMMLDQVEPLGICKHRCGYEHQAAVPLPVSRQFWSECYEMHLNSTIVFATAASFSEFVRHRDLTHPDRVRRIVFTMLDGINFYPMEWPYVVNRSTMAHFTALKNVSVSLVVHDRRSQSALGQLEEKSPILQAPGDFEILYRSLDGCFWGIHLILQALREAPVLEGRNCRLLVQQHLDPHSGRPTPIPLRLYADECFCDSETGPVRRSKRQCFRSMVLADD
jgi:hypothetical protein